MLGLPDGITTCLFDLGGVPTQTAKVHAEAWEPPPEDSSDASDPLERHL